MNIQRTSEHLRAQPFRPFIIATSDGREFLVKHPEFVEADPDSFCVLIHGENGSVVVLRETQIVSIRTKERAQTT